MAPGNAVIEGEAADAGFKHLCREALVCQRSADRHPAAVDRDAAEAARR